MYSDFGDTHRKITYCDRAHQNVGNTCRHNLWDSATGDYLFYLDDDKYLADNTVLETLKQVTEPWAVFPIHRFGQRFFNLPPALNATDAANFIVRRDIGRYPNSNYYASDGMLVEHLKFWGYPYQVVDGRELVVMPQYAGDHQITS